MEVHEIHQSGVTQILKLKAGRNLDFLCSEINMGSLRQEFGVLCTAVHTKVVLQEAALRLCACRTEVTV